jgi:hypothetical protein
MSRYKTSQLAGVVRETAVQDQVYTVGSQSRAVVTRNATVSDVDEMARIYMLSDYPSVLRFLLLHPVVLVTLKEAYPYIASIWGPSTHVNLEICESPDGRSFDTLIAYVQTTDSVDDALGKLSQFAAQWWADRIIDTGGMLQFDVEWTLSRRRFPLRGAPSVIYG